MKIISSKTVVLLPFLLKLARQKCDGSVQFLDYIALSKPPPPLEIFGYARALFIDYL